MLFKVKFISTYAEFNPDFFFVRGGIIELCFYELWILMEENEIY